MKKGAAQLIPILFLLLLLFLLIFVKRDLLVFRKEVPEPSASPSPTESPAASPKPAVSPAPKPSVSPTSTATVLTSAPAGTGYSRFTIATERGNFTISLVSIDMGGARMITDTASDNDCSNACPTLALSEYVSRNAGFAGIHGTYFCPPEYAECASKSNSFDFPVYNSRLGKWINGGNLFWNDRSLVYYDGGGMHFLRNANSFGGGLTAGIVNSPGLVEGGNVIADQFPLSEKQVTKGGKAGIGIRGNVVYLVIANSVDMLDLGHIFKSLGATSALNLDGGGSLALWFGGYKVGPGRSLPNAIIFATK